MNIGRCAAWRRPVQEWSIAGWPWQEVRSTSWGGARRSGGLEGGGEWYCLVREWEHLH